VPVLPCIGALEDAAPFTIEQVTCADVSARLSGLLAGPAATAACIPVGVLRGMVAACQSVGAMLPLVGTAWPFVGWWARRAGFSGMSSSRAAKASSMACAGAGASVAAGPVTEGKKYSFQTQNTRLTDCLFSDWPQIK